MKKLILPGLVALDQMLKFIIRKNMSPGQSVKIIPGLLNISFVTNDASLLGLFSWLPLVWLSVMAIGAIMYSWESIDLPDTVLYILLAGILGNLIDRVFLGYVVDFVEIGFWPVFNLADSCITGSIVYVIYKEISSRVA